MNNLDWLDEELGDFDNDYIIIDCPGESSYSEESGVCGSPNNLLTSSL